MTNWKKYKLGDFVVFNYGKGLIETDRIAGNVPVYGSSGITGWNNKSLINSEGIIVGRKGTVGTVLYSNVPFFPIDTTYYITKNDDKYDLKYLFYLLKTVGLQNLNEDSAVPGLNRNTAYSQEILLPTLPEQKAIAAILSSLDDKIELNRKQNETLEKIAQAIFRHWFVDFEFPEADCKPYKSSGGEMQESELGLIPKGWRVGKLGDVIAVKDGTHDSPKQKTTGKYLITSKHIKEFEIDFNSAYLISEEDFIEVNKRSKVDKNDILLTMIGTVGNIYLVQQENIDFAIKNVGLFKTSAKQELTEYIYLHLKSQLISEYITSNFKGTTQHYITLDGLRNIPVFIPPDNILLNFRNIVKPIIEKIYQNIQQNNTLSQLRDELLPKLMSGKVRVKEVKNEIS